MHRHRRASRPPGCDRQILLDPLSLPHPSRVAKGWGTVPVTRLSPFTTLVLGTNLTLSLRCFFLLCSLEFKELIRSSSMLRQILHRLTAGAMIVLLPATILSADAGTAMLTSGQKVLVNGKQ